ncbi:ABC transporter substrate-binding protein [Candidatus Bathyarchaeota archaeon]|nr:ABC transporter substrate-binding protein [Candidatus Bathyarchaeota archaeon]
MQTQPQSQTPGGASKRTVSLAIAIILLLVGIGAGTAIGYFGVSRLTGTPALCTSGQTITIGELLDLSKDLASQGKRAQASSTLAIQDINSYLSATGCSLRFTNAVTDYALDNDLAQTALSNFAASGVNVVVGPLNSGAAQRILGYANSHHIVLISPSSTAPTLAIPNDYLFRTVPNDANQGHADARMMLDRGAKALIIVSRDDPYGHGLANATQAYFTYLGGQKVIDQIFYPTDTTDFSTYLSTLNSDFNNNLGTGTGQFTAGQIAIDVIAFEEFGSFILKAQSTYSTAFPWSTLPWFGTDGESQDSVIVNATYGGAVSQVRLPSTLYAQSNNSKTIDLIDRFIAANPSLICDSYCLGAYDDTWLAALATLQAGVNDGAKIQASMLTVAHNYYGVQGWDGMQPSGDLIPSNYQIWKVVNSKWVFSGTWTPPLPGAVDNTDTLSWTSVP